MADTGWMIKDLIDLHMEVANASFVGPSGSIEYFSCWLHWEFREQVDLGKMVVWTKSTLDQAVAKTFRKQCVLKSSNYHIFVPGMVFLCCEHEYTVAWAWFGLYIIQKKMHFCGHKVVCFSLSKQSQKSTSVL